MKIKKRFSLFGLKAKLALASVTSMLVFLALGSSAFAAFGYGYGDQSVNWSGSYILNTVDGQIIGYCVDRDAWFPTDGYTVQADGNVVNNSHSTMGRTTPSAAQTAQLSYILAKWGNTTDRDRADAISVITHEYTGQSSTTAAVNQTMYNDMKAEAAANYGPYTITTNVTWVSGNTFTVSVNVTGGGGQQVGAGGAANIPVTVSVSGGTGSGTYQYNGAPITFTSTASGSSVTATATVQSPDHYLIYTPPSGAPEQRVATSGGYTAKSSTDTAQIPFGSVQVHKVTNNPAYQSGQGAVYTLHAGTAAGPVVGTLTVGSNGNSNIVGSLLPGTYYLVETVAPEGQVLNAAPQAVTVTAGVNTLVQKTNAVLNDGQINLVKRDAATSQPLAGATFRVYYDSNNDGSYETQIGGNYITTTNPIVVDNLRVGRYRVIEITPPPGYTLPDPQFRQSIVFLGYGNQTTPSDNVLTGTATISNAKPTIATQVIDADNNAATSSLPYGNAFRDRADITGVASDVTSTITVKLYGPFTTAADITCDDSNLLQTQTFNATGSGQHPSPAFTVQTPGIYTFVESMVVNDGGNATATHECGQTQETVTIEDPTISTQVVDPNATDDPTTTTVDERALNDFSQGDKVADLATVSNVHDTVSGVITAKLYGPFKDPSEITCNASTLYDSVDYDAQGSGQFMSPEFTPQPGIYVFVETWTEVVDINPTTGEPVKQPIVASNTCGEQTETFTDVGITTTVAKQSVAGTPITDTAVVTGITPTQVGEITYQVYGPFYIDACAEDGTPLYGAVATGERACASPTTPIDSEAIQCNEAYLASEQTITATGPGEFTSPGFTPTKAGYYTYVATWNEVLAPGETRQPRTTTHDCGQVVESAYINPRITTNISKQQITLGESVYDTSTISGLGDNVKGTAVFKLYGPFDSPDAIKCTDQYLYSTTQVDNVGNGEHQSPPTVINKYGYYTYVEYWTENGIPINPTTGQPLREPLTGRDACGLGAETTYAPNPLANTGTWPAIPAIIAGTISLLGGSTVLVSRRLKKASAQA